MIRSAAPRVALPPIVLLAIGLSLVATLATTTPGRSATHTVEIADFAFTPATLTIGVGDTVTWTNADPVDHTATSTTGAWDTGLIGQGASASITFTEPGTYDYLCSPHPTMTGRIVVTAAPAGSPPAASPGPGGGAIPDVAMAHPLTRWPLAAGAGLVLLAAVVATRRMLRARAAAAVRVVGRTRR